MAIYAIGDIQGCYDDLQRLLDKINFNEANDQLWFAGDLVNRGPKSLETLRFIKSLGKSAVSVLGNHDLHLLAVAHSGKVLRPKDSLLPVLEAPDREELLDWLRHRPLFHYNRRYCLLHAGVPPQWNFHTTRKMAHKIEHILRGKHYKEFFNGMYGNKPDIWTNDLKGISQIRFAVNCFTRLRYCDDEGRLDFKHKGPLGSQPKHLLPWFEVPNRKSTRMTIIFGHWSSLNYYAKNNCYGIDTGCLWGGELTALKLGEKMQRMSIKGTISE